MAVIGEETIKDDAAFAKVMVLTRQLVGRYVITTAQGEPYLERVILRPDLYLHIIYRSDDDRDMHSHPWFFSSQILHGSYREHRVTRVGDELCDSQDRVFKAGDVNDMRVDQFHRLELIDGPVVTLVKHEAKVASWGFWTKDGFVHNREYLRRKFA